MLVKNVSRLTPLPLPGGAYTYRLDAREIGIGHGTYWLKVKTAQGVKAEKINLMW
jgi:hypothetical protein